MELLGLSHTFENVNLWQLTIPQQIPVILTNVSNIAHMQILESSALWLEFIYYNSESVLEDSALQPIFSGWQHCC